MKHFNVLTTGLVLIALHISIHTVKSHVYGLYRKMDVKSRHQLIHRIGIYGGG